MPPLHSLHFGLTLLLSFGIAGIGFFVDQAFRWTDTWEGFTNGVFFLFILAPFWLIALLPWCVAVYICYRRNGWTRYRTHVALAPSVIILVLTLAGLVFNAPTPQNRLKNITGANFPANAAEIHYHFSGGGFADYRDSYFFTCPPAETQRLIAEMKLEKTESPSEKEDAMPTPLLPGAPDYRQWQDSHFYFRDDDDRGWYYHLVTNSDFTQVFVVTWCL